MTPGERYRSAVLRFAVLLREREPALSDEDAVMLAERVLDPERALR